MGQPADPSLKWNMEIDYRSLASISVQKRRLRGQLTFDDGISQIEEKDICN